MLRLSRALQAAAGQRAVWPWVPVSIWPRAAVAIWPRVAVAILSVEQVMVAGQVVPVWVSLQRPPAEPRLARLSPAPARRPRQVAALAPRHRAVRRQAGES
jgi:hypothetical protein